MSTLSLNLPPSPPGLMGLAASADASGTPNAPVDGAPGAGAFAGILAATQEQLGRQGFAAAAPLAVPALMTQTLGAGLNLITPATPEPAPDSLLAFARSQGLDEGAIAALWGANPASAASLSTPAHLPPPDSAALPTGATDLPPSWPMGTGLGVPMPSGLAVNPFDPKAQPTAAPASGPATPAGDPAAGLQTPLVHAAPIPGAPLHTDGVEGMALTSAPASPSALTTGMTVGVTVPAWALSGLHMARPTAALPPANAAMTGQAPEALADVPELGALASRLLPVVGKPLRAQSALPLETTPANPMVNPSFKDMVTPVEVLDLQADVAQVLALAQAEDKPLEARPSSFAPAPTGATDAAKSPSASAPTPGLISGYQLKMDHFAQLADRLGVALAQRLQQQIERGQWSLQLRLNPAELGQVDVRLDMRSSGLEAVFQADNPLTRELLNQGAGRLREGLTQSGMTVASVWVNSEGGRQSGGNPTPQRQPRSGPADTEASAVASPVGLQPRPSSADGWDVLA